jgi:hypothetical protein
MTLPLAHTCSVPLNLVAQAGDVDLLTIADTQIDSPSYQATVVIVLIPLHGRTGTTRERSDALEVAVSARVLVLPLVHHQQLIHLGAI